MSTQTPLDAPTAEPEPLQPSRRRVGRDAAATLAFRTGSLPFTFAITIITSRLLLPTGRGAFVLALLTVTLAATLLGNVGVAATHELARKEHDEHIVVGQSLSITVALGLIGMLVLFPIDVALADQGFRRVAFVAAGLPAVLVIQTLSAALVAVGRLAFSNFLQFLLPVVTLGGMFVFVYWLDRGTTGAVVAWVVAQTAVAVVGLVGARSLWWPVKLRALPPGRILAMLLLGLRIGLVNLVSVLNYRIELIVLQVDHGLAQVGLYSLATSLAELLWIVSGAIATATIAPVVAVHSDEEAAIITARSVRWALITTAICAVALGIGSWFLIVPIFGTYFESSIHPLILLLPGVVAFAPGTVIAVYFSMRRGQTKYPLGICLVSLAVTGVLALLLVPGHFGVGAAVACSAGYIVGMVLGLWWFARQGHVRLGDLVPSRADVRASRVILRGLVPR